MFTQDVLYFSIVGLCKHWMPFGHYGASCSFLAFRNMVAQF